MFSTWFQSIQRLGNSILRQNEQEDSFWQLLVSYSLLSTFCSLQDETMFLPSSALLPHYRYLVTEVPSYSLENRPSPPEFLNRLENRAVALR